MKKRECLGIDIGGTTAKYAIIGEDGSVRNEDFFPTGQKMNRQEFLQELFQVTDRAIEEDVVGIGICSPGILDPRSGSIVGATENLPFLTGMNLKNFLRERYADLPVYINNDAKAAALGERWMGAARGCENYCCITFGTGLGGAFVIDSKLVEGVHFRAGEIGYLNYRGKKDYLEKKVSTGHLMKIAATRLGIDQINGIQFFERIRKKDPICEKILDEWVEELGRFIANILIMLDLEKIIIGGGISNEKEILFPRLNRKVRELMPEQFYDEFEIVMAQCCNHAGMLGAVSVFFLNEWIGAMPVRNKSGDN